MEQNPQLEWNYDYLCMNPNITWDIVEQYPQYPWKYYYLSLNTMTKAKEQFIQLRVKQHFQEQVCPEIENHCLHPDNFFKLYEWGHHENQYT